MTHKVMNVMLIMSILRSLEIFLEQIYFNFAGRLADGPSSFRMVVGFLAAVQAGISQASPTSSWRVSSADTRFSAEMS